MRRKDNGWSEQGGYMNAKISKLNKQFMDNTQQKISNIFADVCIFINGFTDPSDDVLKKYMEIHGGRFCHYYKKEVVTHIIATNLPKGKINKLTNEKVVTAQWIVDSIEAGRLLDWSNYELYADRHKSNQNMMKSFVKGPEDHGKQIDTGALSLSEFYAKSRLHHLSSWANDLNEYLLELKSQNPEHKFPAREEFLNIHRDNMASLVAAESLLMHVDMDCFFVSVGLRDRTDLIGCPVVVTHSTKTDASSNPSCSEPGAGSMSEIASCSYEARSRGLSNGMHLGRARVLCPDLVTIPYTFPAYLDVAKTLYRIAVEFTHDVSVGSCDELYLELSTVLKHDQDRFVDPRLFAEHLRARIRTETGCNASCGIGENLLLCKLATKRAKPDGCFWLRAVEAADAIRAMQVRDLPGIGRVLERRLRAIGVVNCAQLQDKSAEVLRRNFGIKLGQKLYDMCRGKDNRSLQTDRIRKSISAEINYGIRLDTFEDCSNLLRKISVELSQRLLRAGQAGTQLVLKLLVRQAQASVESVKYLGHGICDSFSRSIRLKQPINDAVTIEAHALDLFRASQKPVRDLRGVGLVMQKLDSGNRSGSTRNILEFFPSKSIKKSQSNNSTIKCDSDRQSDEECDRDDDCTIIDDNDVIGGLVTGVVKGDSTHQASIQPSQKKAHSAENRLKIKDIFADSDRQPHRIVPVRPQFESTDQDTIDGLTELGRTSIDKLHMAIIRWVDEEPVPNIEDGALIRHQLLQMVLDDVTVVYEFLDDLRTRINDKHNSTANLDAWNCCYEDILASVQAYCFQQFGAYLEFD